MRDDFPEDSAEIRSDKPVDEEGEQSKSALDFANILQRLKTTTSSIPNQTSILPRSTSVPIPPIGFAPSSSTISKDLMGNQPEIDPNSGTALDRHRIFPSISEHPPESSGGGIDFRHETQSPGHPGQSHSELPPGGGNALSLKGSTTKPPGVRGFLFEGNASDPIPSSTKLVELSSGRNQPNPAGGSFSGYLPSSPVGQLTGGPESSGMAFSPGSSLGETISSAGSVQSASSDDLSKTNELLRQLLEETRRLRGGSLPMASPSAYPAR